MKLSPGYKQTEVGVIPEDWTVVPFQQLLDFRNGINADRRAYGRGMPFINVFEIISKGHLKAQDIPGRVSIDKKSMESYLVRRGDIVFNRSSETQDEVGLSSVYLDDAPAVFGGFVIRGQCKQALDPVYSGYAFRAPVIRTQMVARGQGAIRANIGQSDLKQIHALLPSLDEQRAIAEALSDADALIESLYQLITKKRQIKQGAMQELLTGKRRLPGFSGGWEVKCLNELAEIDPEQLSSNTQPDYEFKYISLEDVDFGALRGHSLQVFDSAPSRARRRLRIDDLLVSTVRPNLKSHLWFRDRSANWVCSTGFSVVRCFESLSHPGYVFAHLFAEGVSKQIDALLTGSNYPAINSRDVRQLQIPVPKLEEQAAIATVLSDMDTELTALESRLAKARQIKQGMMQALLTGRIRLL
ncbi:MULTISPECIES: restriction endonuclease subunit S [unclassified Simplicispira]|uniref:restriction endonuclease subunit S n=1 Tax=unclassified Simplicispira TaxID=2630407 RepID=UPI000D5DA0B2|nr:MULTISPECIES: restriction endonuclease subunit S [unclassified Simplicispira]PVY55711.1 type I restriction enzyme S subunit [Simplicispira sp. 125]REG16654.1 type I restriction enzyme S subunit [Simplicispira sp. 110]